MIHDNYYYCYYQKLHRLMCKTVSNGCSGPGALIVFTFIVLCWYVVGCWIKCIWWKMLLLISPFSDQQKQSRNFSRFRKVNTPLAKHTHTTRAKSIKSVIHLKMCLFDVLYLCLLVFFWRKFSIFFLTIPGFSEIWNCSTIFFAGWILDYFFKFLVYFLLFFLSSNRPLFCDIKRYSAKIHRCT